MQGISDNTVKPKIVATFEYKDIQGKNLYIKERIEPARNGRSKEFIFKHLEDGKQATGRGCEPVLYNLPELIESKYTFIVEGEAKADLLMKWGLIATCLDSGANSPFKDDYLKYFEGKEKVVILPDNDTPSKAYANRIASASHGKVEKIKVVELPELKEAEDIINWAKVEGNNKEKLLEIVKASPEWTPEKESTDILSSLESWQHIQSLEIKVEWIVDRVIPKESITLVFGKGGIGKTWLTLDMARYIGSGIPYLGLSTIKVPVIFDTLRASHGKDENVSNDMGLIMGRLKELRDMGFTIILLHHTAKNSDKVAKGSHKTLDSVEFASLPEGYQQTEKLNLREGVL